MLSRRTEPARRDLVVEEHEPGRSEACLSWAVPPRGCVELAGILANWDGHFSVLMRKRIARHIDSCTSCERNCRELVNPKALLGVAPILVAAPWWLRGQR
jgi:hypothetical protein